MDVGIGHRDMRVRKHSMSMLRFLWQGSEAAAAPCNCLLFGAGFGLRGKILVAGCVCGGWWWWVGVSVCSSVCSSVRRDQDLSPCWTETVPTSSKTD